MTNPGLISNVGRAFLVKSARLSFGGGSPTRAAPRRRSCKRDAFGTRPGRRTTSASLPGEGACRLRGFTLFEVLIAMALSAMLIAAVYTALSMHISRTQRAYTDVEQTGVARGVLRKIASDLRSALYQSAPTEPQNESGTEQGGAAAGGSQDPPAEEPVTGSSARELGLWGESDWLLFDVGLSLRRMQGSEADAASPPAMRMVLYSVDDGTQEEPAGLVRKEVSREQAELVGFDLGSLFDAAEATELLAEEVRELGFRYYDGVEWQSSWDSSLMGGLPRAVEVLIGVQPIDGGQESVPYRLVVALPTASVNRASEDYQLLQGEQGTGL